MVFQHYQKSSVHHKIPVKAKILTQVFQRTFLGEFVYLATALTALAMSGRFWLAGHIKHPTSSRKRPVALGFRLSELVEFETVLERVSPARTNAYTTVHRK